MPSRNSSRTNPVGDMDHATFRRHGHSLVDWIADYLNDIESYPVLSRVQPGQIREALPNSPPKQGVPFEETFRDFERIILPGITHWNHPGFFAYFAISGSGPGILAEFLASALNVQAMLWRTSPSATELEEVTLGWLRQLMGLPDSFEGVIYDTASIATLHALAAARQQAVPSVRVHGLAGRTDVGPLRVYTSEQAHSSIDKAVITLGLGQDALRKIPVDENFRLRPQSLRSAIEADLKSGVTPLAVVATVGTTSTTSIDPIETISDICTEYNLWLHVDAAYAGAAALVPETRSVMDGCSNADSVVVNPHKWLFTPFDLSAFYCRRMDLVRAAFSLTPEYLQTPEASQVRNLMDTGIQLGRRFRALKLWAVIQHFGSDGLAEKLTEHMRLAKRFAAWVDASQDFETVAPVPLSVVCFRAHGKSTASDTDTLNTRLLDHVNASGEVFLSHTRLKGNFTLRLAIGNVRTTETHVRRAWELLIEGRRLLVD